MERADSIDSLGFRSLTAWQRKCCSSWLQILRPDGRGTERRWEEWERSLIMQDTSQMQRLWKMSWMEGREDFNDTFCSPHYLLEGRLIWGITGTAPVSPFPLYMRKHKALISDWPQGQAQGKSYKFLLLNTEKCLSFFLWKFFRLELKLNCFISVDIFI